MAYGPRFAQVSFETRIKGPASGLRFGNTIDGVLEEEKKTKGHVRIRLEHKVLVQSLESPYPTRSQNPHVESKKSRAWSLEAGDRHARGPVERRRERPVVSPLSLSLSLSLSLKMATRPGRLREAFAGSRPRIRTSRRAARPGSRRWSAPRRQPSTGRRPR